MTRKNRIVSEIIVYAVLAVLALICLIPFYNIFINATHSNAEIATSYNLLPGRYLHDNFLRMQSSIHIWGAFLNSLFVAVISTALSSYFGALTAYGFSKYDFAGRKVLFWVLLSTMMLPPQLGLIGYFQLMNTLHLIDRLAALIIPSIANASAVFFIVQYMQTGVPDELIDSARVDGCGEIMIFHRIIFPLITPAVFTQAIFIFVSSWNNFINPLILLFSPEKLTLPVVIQQLSSFMEADYGVIYLGMTISVIPIVIFASIFMKYIIGGLTVGAVKE